MLLRLHPNKGGDTKQFQALQDAYQDVLRKKREHDVAKAAMQAQAQDESGQGHDTDVVEVILAAVQVCL